MLLLKWNLGQVHLTRKDFKEIFVKIKFIIDFLSLMQIKLLVKIIFFKKI